jgi:NAD(P)-dependent dehydrogenase (short-subunit alcohol dehydrogenase family)
MRVLITGSNRGIGLELARQYAAAGNEVIGTCRATAQAGALAELAAQQPTVRIRPLDVADPASVADLADSLASDRIDVLFNNAASYGRSSGALDAVDPADWMAMFQVNTVGPLLVSRALLPALRRGTDPKVVGVSSIKASMARNVLGASYQYRATKAALNAVIRSLAVDLRGDGIGVFALSPGWVDQGEHRHVPLDFAGRLRQARRLRVEFGEGCARQTLPQSASRMIATVNSLGLDDSGGFFDHLGRRLDW